MLRACDPGRFRQDPVELAISSSPSSLPVFMPRGDWRLTVIVLRELELAGPWLGEELRFRP
jgi:hypothetical protein